MKRSYGQLAHEAQIRALSKRPQFLTPIEHIPWHELSPDAQAVWNETADEVIAAVVTVMVYGEPRGQGRMYEETTKPDCI